MSATQFKSQPLSSSKAESSRSWQGNPPVRSGAAKLIELGITFAAAASRVPLHGVCSRCGSYRNPLTSTAQNPNIFCSRLCEQDFVRSALASLTLEDCIRMQERLESLATGAKQSAIRI